MLQMLPAAQSAVHVVAAKLPEPTAKVTVPIIVVFALLALVLLWRMGKEGGTARGGDMRETLASLHDFIARKLHAAHFLRERRKEP